MKEISFAATGDYLQTRRVPSFEDPRFKEVAVLIKKADARITNLENTISYNEGTPGPMTGGTNLQAVPETLEDMIAYGFNLVGTANNHAFDYSYNGLKLTKKYLNEYKILNTGTGDNLFEAGRPVYLETAAGRIAFIAVTAPMHKTQIATEQRRDSIGRPGVNPLRYKRVHVISKEDLEALKRIADKTEVNAIIEAGIKLGFAPPLPGNMMLFGTDITGMPMVFTAGENEGLITQPDERDLKRIENTIDDARRQADYVLVSCHCHEWKGSEMACPPDFLHTAARRFIDAGANAVIGYGFHGLRGIEIYNKRPIFYGLGNFIYQCETVETLPQDFYDENNFSSELTVMQAIDKRTNNGTMGMLGQQDALESVITHWTMEDGGLKEILLYPIELGYGRKRHQNGFPEITKNEGILNRLSKMSELYGTKINIEGGVGKISLS